MLLASGTSQALLWVAILAAVVIVGGVVMLALRRTLLKPDEGADGSFLDELRAMRDRGEISSEEYDATIRSVRERLRRDHLEDTPSEAQRTDPGRPGDGRTRR